MSKKLFFLLLVFCIINLSAFATARSWIGRGAGGSGTDISAAANWSPAGVPVAADVCTMLLGATNGVVTLTQSAVLSMTSLSITLNTNTGALRTYTVNISRNLTVSGTLTIVNSCTGNNDHQLNVNITGGTTSCGAVTTIASGPGGGSGIPELNVTISSGITLGCLGAWNSSCPSGSLTVTTITNNGTLTIGGATTASSAGSGAMLFLVGNSPAVTTFFDAVSLGSDAYNNNTSFPNSTILGGSVAGASGRFAFRNDFTIGPSLGTNNNFNTNGVVLFDGAGTQTVTDNGNAFSRILGTVQIGNTNNPTVNIVKGTTPFNKAFDIYTALIVNGTSTLSIGVGETLNEYTTGSAALTLNGSAVLKIADNTGGISGSNFPSGYNTYTISSTSTVDYNAAGGTNQTIFDTPTYGNLTLSRLSGASTTTKTSGGAITATGNITISSGALFDVSASNYATALNGNWVNNGAFTQRSGMVTFNSGNSTLSGATATIFNNLTLNKTSAANSLTLSGVNTTVNAVAAIASGTIVINGNTLTLNGTTTGTGTLTGSLASNLAVGGTSGGNLGTVYFISGSRLLNNLTLNRTGVNAAATLGTDLTVGAAAAITSGALGLNGQTLTLNGSISGTGTLTGSAASNLSIGGSGSNLGTVYFTIGSQALNTITLNRTGVVANAAVILGTSLTAEAITLTNGILVTGAGNLFTWNNTGALTSPSGAGFASSFIATCQANGSPLTITVPYNGTVGFRINNITGAAVSASRLFPVSATYLNSGSFAATPNRMILNNSGTADHFTVVVNKETLPNTPLPGVNRVWYLKEGTAGGSRISMWLGFTKRTSQLFPVVQDEIEPGFIYSDPHLIQQTYSNQFVNNAKTGVPPAGDIPSFITGYADGDEINGQYTRGVSPDLFGGTNGITGFTRFSVVNASTIILPVSITNVKAYQKNNAIQVDFTAMHELNMQHYEAERSSDAVNFNAVIKTVEARNNGLAQNNYSLTDEAPLNGKNFYRVKSTDRDGKFSYTAVVSVDIRNGKASVTVQPNPVVNRQVTLIMNNVPAGKYDLVVYNGIGQKIYRQTITHTGGSAAQSVNLPQSAAAGMYIVKLSNETAVYNTYILVK